MASADHPPRDVLGIRHPSPHAQGKNRQGRGLSAGGRYAMGRVVAELQGQPGDEGQTVGLTGPELAMGLGVRTCEADQMAMSAWRAGLVQFDVVGGDLVFRLLPGQG